MYYLFITHLLISIHSPLYVSKNSYHVSNLHLHCVLIVFMISIDVNSYSMAQILCSTILNVVAPHQSISLEGD